MRFAIADASPIHYLVLLGFAEYLEDLYGIVLLPEKVAHELQAGNAPAIVSRWVQAPPAWTKIVPEKAQSEFRNVARSIDAGERAVLQLALGNRPEAILMDDRAGVAEAQRLGLNVIGTLGILVKCAERGWIDLRTALDTLRRTNFRVHPKLIREILDAHYGD